MSNKVTQLTEGSVNFYTGCTKISPGCTNCPALKYNGVTNPILSKSHLTAIEKYLKDMPPSRICVNQMTDTFHEELQYYQIDEMFDTLQQFPHHQYIIITKRPIRAKSYFRDRIVPDNFWMGVSVENGDERWLRRIDILRLIDARIRVVYFEPLIGPIPDVDFTNISLVVVSGESGPNARPMHSEWVQKIMLSCKKQNVPFHYLQHGGTYKCSCHDVWGCCILNGQIHNELPSYEQREIVA